MPSSSHVSRRSYAHCLHFACFPVAIAILCGCAKLPEGRSAIDDVVVRGADEVPASDIEAQIATTASPKFLGLFRGVAYDYEIFDPYVLQRDLARVERYYRARGFYEAHARAGRIRNIKPGHVRVEIVVEEGAPVLNREVRVLGVDGLPVDVQLAAKRAALRKLREGQPFDEDRFKEAETEVKRALTDRGYAYAKVTSEVYVDLVQHAANSVFTATPEAPAKFGKISIVGLDRDGKENQEIPEAPLLRAIDIQEGDPFSTAAIDAATQALLDLEVFASVEIVPDIPDPPPAEHVVPITVKVEPSRLRQLRLGGGVEFDQIKTDLHLVFGWEDHNLLGGLRDFSVEFKPGVVLYPTRADNLVAPERGLFEERLRLQLKQPGFIEARTNGFVRPSFNVFPLLVNTAETGSAPVVVGYREVKSAVGVDRSFFKVFFASLAYNTQVEDPFTYKGPLDDTLRTLILSYPELTTQLDFRDDRIHPRKGVFLSNSLQVAGGPFLGHASDVKVEPEVRTYVPITRRVTFATRASLGFLLPFNYGDVVRNHLDPTNDPVTDANRADRVRDIEIVFFRGFFSGGANSNRGFPIRGIAPHGVVPFLNPATAAQQIAQKCVPTASNNFTPDPATCSIPIGGFTLWELSNELRFAVSGPFSAATFCDMSDVSPHPVDIRPTHLHLSCGLGARYETPVGPIRLDVGYRVQPLQVLGFRSEDAVVKSDPVEGVQPKLFQVPIAIAIGIGEAY
jgi:outer membrane protein insertion porin family/translocation and assembly module TamA